MKTEQKEIKIRNWQAVNAWNRNSAGPIKSIKRNSRRIEKEKAIKEQRDER